MCSTWLLTKAALTWQPLLIEAVLLTLLMSFHVTVEPAQETFTVNADETILSAAKQQGLPLPHACQSGTCGACQAHLDSGHVSVLQVQQALSEADLNHGQILLCCTAAQSDVVVTMPKYQGAQAIVPHIMPTKISGLVIDGNYAVLTLALPKNKSLRFHPGQYADVLLRQQQRRSYSIAAYDETNHTLELHVRRHVDGVFSEPLFSGKLPINSMLRLQLPLGSFALQESAKPLLMLATGTGIAPIKAMLAQLVRIASPRPLALYWGMSQNEWFYDTAAIMALIGALPHTQIHLVASHPSAAWAGLSGHVQDCAIRNHPDLHNHEVYACGNPHMIDDAYMRCINECGLPESAFFADRFTPTTHNA